MLSKVLAGLQKMDEAAAAREDARCAMFFEHERLMWERQERLRREDNENHRLLFEMLLSRVSMVQTPQP